MSTNPLVSIITPSYNQAEFLEQTILSVLEQEYDPIEYIIVDGASADGSIEIIKKYEKDLGWWVSEPDKGQADAVNKGLRRAKGEIVAWLNSDDLYLPHTISQAVINLQVDDQPGMVFGDAITIDENGKPLNKLEFGEWGLVELLSFRIICQPAVFMRKCVLDSAGYLDLGYHFMLDHHLWIRIASKANIHHVKAGSNIQNVGGNNEIAGYWAAARHHRQAKNVSQATGFARETMELLAWIEQQPELAPIVSQHKKVVLAGAYRLNGRYLLDGGMPKAALKSYWKAAQNKPGFTLRHWHRVIYAIAYMLGAGGLADHYYRLASRFPPDLKNYPDLRGWPGLLMDEV